MTIKRTLYVYHSIFLKFKHNVVYIAVVDLEIIAILGNLC